MSGDLINGVVFGSEQEWSLMSLLSQTEGKTLCEFAYLKICRKHLSDRSDHSSSPQHRVGLEGGVGRV